MAAAKPSSLLATRVVYCGDNLDQLRKLPAACVDLIYIDLPFRAIVGQPLRLPRQAQRLPYKARAASSWPCAQEDRQLLLPLRLASLALREGHSHYSLIQDVCIQTRS